MNTTIAKNPLGVNTPPNNYIFDGKPNGKTDENIVYLPVEVDTEFWHPPICIDKPNKFKQLTLTHQYRAKDREQGRIYADIDIASIARHPLADTSFSLLSYLRDELGVPVELRRNAWKADCEKVLHIYLYSFFALAELFRLFRGLFRDDIRRACTDDGIYKIGMKRRLTTDKRKGQYEDYIELPYWELIIDGVSYRVRLTIIDTCAVHGNSSYADFCKNAGIELKYKDLFSSTEKADMIRMYQERPEDFDNYATGDLYNYDALVANAEKFKGIYDQLGISEFYEIPRLTIGSTVSRIFEACLMKSLGYTDKKILRKLTQHGTAKNLLENGKTTAQFLAKVDGGRCRNNRPTDIRIKGLLADIDISGCYGEGLRNQQYPIGRPSVLDYPIPSDINQYLTLKQFLKKYESELVPGLWFARVSTKKGYILKHPQDFLISWYPPDDYKTVMRTDTDNEGINYWEEDNVGLSKIFTNEVNMAVLNHDLLQLIETVCSKHQRAELLNNLIVECAVFYPASERVNNIEVLEHRLANHKGKNTTEIRNGKKISVIGECNSWMSLPMDELLVNKLLLERKKHPKKTPLNELYKLCINTIYGDMVSPFFQCGNTIVGNNITARARVMAWCMEKGLNGVQSITDGCPFELNRVIFPIDNGYLTASSLVEMNDMGKQYRYAPLGNEPWEVIKTKNSEIVIRHGDNYFTKEGANRAIDELALKHLQTLFPGVDVLNFKTTDVSGRERSGQFGFEVKDIYGGGVFHGSANYAFFNFYGWLDKYKMRSYKKDGCTGIYKFYANEITHHRDFKAVELFFNQLWHNPDEIPRQEVFLQPKILKIGEYAQHKDKFENSLLFPGCTVEVARLIRECSLNAFTFKTHAQWKQWDALADRLRRQHDQTFETLYTTPEGKLRYKAMILGIYTAIKAMDRLLDKNYHTDQLKGHPKRDMLALAKKRLEAAYGVDVLGLMLLEEGILQD